ncbi:TriD protein [Yersinia ruckeri]|uniref:Minor pilin of type IV secretion complex (VirB5) n=1 Tax=Yersinia ruckeri TaxID=29486 RepID=A0A0A8VKC8_YERRU|nr:Minor pilin of type IV secretion complex (VirB5) [Yersinia ruckeri]CNI50305.1 TriD protein [Yersinia ruckeri]SUQ37275.1 TriD protein [Yersinia ruckeri]
MQTRNIILALSLFISTSVVNAVILVFDTVRNTNSTNQWMQKLQQWQTTVIHYKRELDSYKQQLATATGIRDIQGFLLDAKT